MRTLEQDAVSRDAPEHSVTADECESWRAARLENNPEVELFAREEWKLACRIATSKGMAKSELLPRFLLHICEMSLRGRKEEITEQRIGMLIFNRPLGYNPGEDNIVRSYARTLRKRLDDYFLQDGRDEPLRMTIPRGGYVPLFAPAPTGDRRNEDSAPSIATPPQSIVAPSTRAMITRESPGTGTIAVVGDAGNDRRVWLAAALGMLCGALIATAIWFASAMAHRGQ
ncbi:hypothetical protein [Terriglobus roseus]|uniref:Uncharacterized protein n=1 Tax=Terriglobus roseus TaxID=392734 RepID=A0A1H4RZB2_9BACT|nr:hypothetical protein [Terriglobus roseus]SEC36931.1 hypothetical protein SAMN05443244_3290 [Terriglobus roseus]